MVSKILLALTFFTRLPVGKRDFGAITLAESAWAFPLIGALIGGLSGGFYLLMLKCALPAHIAAWLTIIFTIILTGGLHEDGLADTADGLAAGRDRDKKLAIMRDSRIGSYGVLALIAVTCLRAEIISGFYGNWQTVLVFACIGACSRAILVIFMHLVAYSRSDGLAASAGKPDKNNTLIAVALSVMLLLLTGKIFAAAIAYIALAIIYVAVKDITLKNFGGITGDVLGAVQRISEVALLLIFLIYSK